MYDIITIGDSTIDSIIIIDHNEAKIQCDLNKDNCLLCLNYADKIPIQKTTQSVGGNAANVASGCKKTGLKTAIVTELGDDVNGFIIKHELERVGVNTNLVKTLKNQETRYSVILNYESERTILSYYVKRNYSLPKLPSTNWIYYTSLGASFENVQTKLLKHLFKHPSVKLAMNPGSYQMKNGLTKLKEILPYVNLLVVNKQEAERLVGKKKTTQSFMKAFHNIGVKIVVITDGLKGSHASKHDEKGIYFMPTYPIKAIARTGAGDAYTSGFLSAILHKKSIPQAMQWGTANAGGVIQEIGAQKGLLTKTGIEKNIKKYKKTKPKLI